MFEKLKDRMAYSNGKKIERMHWVDVTRGKNAIIKDLRKQIKRMVYRYNRKIDSIERATKISSELLGGIKGMEMLLRTTIEKNIQNQAGMMHTLNGKIMELENQYFELVNTMKKITK